MARKIVAAGHVCLDITPVFAQAHKMDPASIFLPGRLLTVGRANMSAGGAVYNTGLAMQFFGADVTVMGKVGADDFGRAILDLIHKADVHDHIRVCDDCDTSYTIVLAPPGVDRIFLHCAGANDTFGCDDIDFAAVAQADLFHFGYPPLMRKMYEHPDELVAMYKKARELGVQTSLDMAAVTEESDAGKADWPAILKAVLPYVDYFVPSVEELCFMLDRALYRRWVQRAAGRDVTQVLDWKQDVRPLADQLLEWGAQTVLIKCGTPGMYLRTGATGRGAEWDNTELWEPSFRAEQYCSGTGAGDASIAAFLTAALEGYGPRQCVQLAAGAGACSVAAYDALGGLLPFDAMLAKIAAGWPKIY